MLKDNGAFWIDAMALTDSVVVLRGDDYDDDDDDDDTESEKRGKG